MGTECLVMAKPAGPRCNLRCGYCYYLKKESLFPAGPLRMGESLLERFIAERLSVSPGPVTHFEWHGGEPTLLGLGYFRSIVLLQRRHRPPGRKITNGLQTNGTLLDGAWAEFLAREGFSVGLSLDGPAEFHDAYRRTADGGPTHGRVMDAFRLLRKAGVPCNVLCVLHAGNAAQPDRVYDFFRSLGVGYLQFLPLVVRPTDPGGGAMARPEVIGEFLCRLFDLWIREDVGRIVIQAFDEALRPLYGAPHALCVHRETCGEAAVLEHDGGFYACDHFVDPQHRIGSLAERGLAGLTADPDLLRFGSAKRDTLPQACRGCDVLSFCNGGCPKDRLSGVNVLCPAYKRFFRHAKPELARLSDHMKAGRALRSFRAARA